MYKGKIILLFCICLLHANFLVAGITEKELKNKATAELNVNIIQANEQDSLEMDFEKKSLLDEIVNLPFSKKVSSKITEAVTVLNPEEILKYDYAPGVNEILGGRVPGFAGGTNLRGLGNALVIIDGIPRPTSSIRAEEIEQITVLKDANAAALYGVHGRNGIILITTRKGKVGRKETFVTLDHGYGKPIRYPNYLGAADYMELYNEALANDGLPPLYPTDAITNTRSSTNSIMYPDVDYYDSRFLKDFKSWTRVVTEFSGGNENAQYYVNAGASFSGSILKMGEGSHENDQRYNVRGNLDFRINKNIKSFLNVVAAYDIGRRANGNYWLDASTLLPNLYPPLIDSASVVGAGKEFLSSAKFVDGKYLLGGTSTYLNNVWGNLNFSGHNTLYNTVVQFTNGVEFDLNTIAKGLKFNTYFSLDSYNQFSETISNTYAVYEPVWSENEPGKKELSLLKRGVDKFSGTQHVTEPVVQRNFGYYGILEYSNIFIDKHAVSASLLAFGSKFNQTGLPQPAKNAHLGGRFNYVYNNKYIFDFSPAFIGSGKLAPSRRIGFSPSVSAGWLISQENFLKDNQTINFLKLKASLASLKTDLTIPDYYLYEAQFAETGYLQWNDGHRSLRAIELNVEPNYNLFFEVRKEFNLGLEALLFKSLGVDLNLFNDRISGIVTQRKSVYPQYLGEILPYENFEENGYKGIELGIDWKRPVTQEFSFNIGVNMTLLQTEVIKKDEFWEFDYLYRSGKPVNSIFGLEALGLFKNNEDIVNHNAVQTFGNVQPGDIKYKDQNNDGVIDDLDVVEIGNWSPNVIGALSFALNYNNFTFFGLLSGYRGSKSISSNNYYWVYGDRKYSEVVLDRWTPETAETASFPRLTSKANSNNFRTSTFWLYDNSMISINQLQLTYIIPESVGSKISTKDLQFFVRASNVASFSKNRDKLELNVGSQPQYRYMSLGVKALF